MNEVLPLARFFDPHFGREVVKIKPGEFFATTRPVIIATVLGSCVAACVRDLARGGAGMNHFMLPAQGDGASAHAAPSLRYGEYAMESLINEFIKHGSRRSDLEAKVFGGAAVAASIAARIGDQNSEFVVAYLAAEGIETSVSDLGGCHPRKVLFFVETGEVRVKYLERMTNDTIQAREAEYARELRAAPRAPSVELF